MYLLHLFLLINVGLRWVAATAYVNMPQPNNWGIGVTLDDNFEIMPTPFTTESMAAFHAAWAQTTATQLGTFTMTSKITNSIDEYLEVLDIRTSLSVTSLLFSVDAHVNFAKEHTMSESDVAVVVKATAKGKKAQLELTDYNLLELDGTEMDDLDAWQAMYGQYIIIGYEYGGEIMFQSTYESKSDEDKTAIEAGLGVSFSTMGFDVGVGVDIEATSSDTSMRYDIDSFYSIRPNSVGEEAEALVSTLSEISQGGMAADDTLMARFSASAKAVLSNDADPINAIVVPLTIIKAVHNVFVDNPEFSTTVLFMEFMNEIYLTIVGMGKQIDMTMAVWSETDPESYGSSTDPESYGFLMNVWNARLKKYETEMGAIKGITKVIEWSAMYLEMSHDQDWSADVMTATSFLQISRAGLEGQFKDAIMQPFWTMLDLKETLHPTTAHPTLHPTVTPTTAEPTPSPTDDPTSWFVPAVNKGGNPTNLGECEGDCDDDFHCVGALLCWHRDSESDPLPPGCSGSPHEKSHDYCYDATKGVQIVDSEVQGGTALYECEGDCDYDSDCVGTLMCWFRGWGYHTSLPPGCVGEASDSWRDYCYDPAKNGEAPPTYFVFEVTGFQSSIVLIAIVAMCAVLICKGFNRFRAARSTGYAKVVVDSEEDFTDNEAKPINVDVGI